MNQNRSRNGKRICLFIVRLGLVLFLILGVTRGRSLWKAWRIHRPECIAWTGNCAVGAHHGTFLWGVKDRSAFPDAMRCGERVIIVRDQGVLECRSLLDGKLTWSAAAAYSGKPSRDFSTIVHGHVVIQSGKDLVRALDLSTGTCLWMLPLESTFTSSPAVIPVKDCLVIRGDLSLECCDLATKTARWRKQGNTHDVRPFDGESVIAVIDEDLVRIALGDGAESWRIKASPGGECQRILVEGTYVIAGGRGRSPYTSCFDGATGGLLWSCSNKAPYGAALAPDREHLLLAHDDHSRNAEVVAVRTSTWTQAWSCRLNMDSVEIHLERDRVFVGSFESASYGAALECLDLINGKVLWTADVRGIPVEHMVYRNSISLLRRENWIALIGCASAGDYVETFDAETGTAISRWRSREGDW